MSRSVRAVVIALLTIAALGTQAPVAAADPGQDRAAGIGEVRLPIATRSYRLTFIFSARSGPAGEDPRGSADTFFTENPQYRTRMSVTCLAVTGNRAVVGVSGVLIRDGAEVPIGQEFLVVDGGPDGADDRYAPLETPGPLDCVAPALPPDSYPLAAGNITVHDASPARCGDVVKEDTTLYADLVDCPEAGLVIGARGVTLDLNGHVIDGGGPEGGGRVGVVSVLPDVRIEGGTIRDFLTGVSLGPILRGGGGQDNVLRDLRLIGNGAGLHATQVRGTVVERGVVAGNGVGLLVEGAQIRMEGTSVSGNDRGVRMAFLLGDNVVAGNRIVGNLGDGLVVEREYAFPRPSPSSLSVVRNLVHDNGGDGVLVRDDLTTLVEDNGVRRNGDDGIDVACPDAGCASGGTRVTRNTANRNAGLGIEAGPATTDGGGNRARRNGDPRQCVGVSCE